MAAQFQVAGPQLIYVGTGASQAYEFLGTAERAVEVSLSGSFVPVLTDVSGGSVPADVQMDGIEAYLSMTIVRPVQAVLSKIQARIATATEGLIPAGSIGTLMGVEGLNYPVCLVSPYQSKSFYSSMHPAWVFPNSWPDREIAFGLGTRYSGYRINFRAIPIWNYVTLAGTLYTNTLPGSLPPSS